MVIKSIPSVRWSSDFVSGAKNLLLPFLLLPTAAGELPVSFSREIAPILVENCLQCHREERPRGSYRVDQASALMAPGDSNLSPVIPGKPEESEFFLRLITPDKGERMPQKSDPLPPVQLELIRRWILEGAELDGPGEVPLIGLIDGSHPDPPQFYPHPWPVVALAFHPHRGELLSGGYHELLVWDVNTGELLRRIGGLPQRIQALAFHPEGTLLAVAGGAPGLSGELNLIERQAPPVRLSRTSEVMLALAFHPTGDLLAAGGADSAIRIFEVSTGQEKTVLYATADWVTSLAFDPEGKFLLAGSRDRSVRLFSLPDFQLETTYLEHRAPITSVAFSADGKKAISGGRDKKVHVWQIEDGRKLGEISTGGEVQRVKVDGESLFICSSDGKVEEYKLENRARIRVFSERGDWVHILAISPDLSQVAAGRHDGTIELWDREMGTRQAAFISVPQGRETP
jgi:hypothetical protein